jgi:hypothetical protein
MYGKLIGLERHDRRIAAWSGSAFAQNAENGLKHVSRTWARFRETCLKSIT